MCVDLAEPYRERDVIKDGGVLAFLAFLLAVIVVAWMGRRLP